MGSLLLDVFEDIAALVVVWQGDVLVDVGWPI